LLSASEQDVVAIDNPVFDLKLSLFCFKSDDFLTDSCSILISSRYGRLAVDCLLADRTIIILINQRNLVKAHILDMTGEESVRERFAFDIDLESSSPIETQIRMKERQLNNYSRRLLQSITLYHLDKYS
jgi:hypothetical protein